MHDFEYRLLWVLNVTVTDGLGKKASGAGPPLENLSWLPADFLRRRDSIPETPMEAEASCGANNGSPKRGKMNSRRFRTWIFTYYWSTGK